MSFPDNSPAKLPISSLQVLLLDSGQEASFSKNDWETRAQSLGFSLIVTTLPLDADWGQSVEIGKANILCPWVLLVPNGTNPNLLDWINNNRDLLEALDGVTFRRKGGKSPWILWLLSWCFLQPIRLLLEIPFAKNDSWLGWSNWKWEGEGYWLFGVRNHDPLNPIRLLRSDWLQKIPLQSKTIWGNLEMLAKAHFLGIRLAEEICPVEVKVGMPYPSEWSDLKMVLKSPRFAVVLHPKDEAQKEAN